MMDSRVGFEIHAASCADIKRHWDAEDRGQGEYAAALAEAKSTDMLCLRCGQAVAWDEEQAKRLVCRYGSVDRIPIDWRLCRKCLKEHLKEQGGVFR